MDIGWRNGFWLLWLLFAPQAWAANAGWTQIEVPAASAGGAATTVALYYPTAAPARAVAMGPFSLEVAIGAPPADGVKGLVVMSHGIGGSELLQSGLAQALARHGYLVAALRHPGDNWQDASLLASGAQRYFEERPRQVSHVIDALLVDPRWKDRIATDARGPRIGAVGHSAGGYTVLALAGAAPDVRRIGRHCRDEPQDDPVFCAVSRSATSAPPASASASAPLADPRVRAVVAMAPAGVVFTAESLAAVRPTTLIYEAELDRFLVPRFHAEWVAKNLPAANLHRVPNAWHFAFVDRAGMPIPTADGDLSADPPGFDRAAYLPKLADEVVAFFDDTLR